MLPLWLWLVLDAGLLTSQHPFQGSHSPSSQDMWGVIPSECLFHPSLECIFACGDSVRQKGQGAVQARPRPCITTLWQIPVWSDISTSVIDLNTCRSTWYNCTVTLLKQNMQSEKEQHVPLLRWKTIYCYRIMCKVKGQTLILDIKSNNN